MDLHTNHNDKDKQNNYILFDKYHLFHKKD
nr:MAG TPA: hypothetical protein [Caudoviricetes sp.]